MGFFQDLKEDLSQAVNELMPDEKSGESDLDSEMLSKDEDVTIFDSEVPEDITELNSLLDDISSYEENEVEEEKSLEQALEEELAALEDTENEELEANENPIKRVEIFTNYKGEKNMDVQNSNSKVLDETALITAGMTITGDVNSKGSIEVIGNIVGDINVLGKLNITGSIQGNSKAAEIYADSANIVGEVHSEGTVKIGQSSVIIGNIIATSAVIAGAIKGDIDVRGPVVLDTSAIVMGNIKSKSVQINNGAVIEGLCSQCYAEVNPTAFFEDFKKVTKK
ncbi:MAG TPA: polymer-forming cytoskeletal protein [Lachnospiraceae bacterium]|nr:polymer-forming cytoskeletal protein [Lachnospiraceae bacterium]